MSIRMATLVLIFVTFLICWIPCVVRVENLPPIFCHLFLSISMIVVTYCCLVIQGVLPHSVD